MRVPYNVLDAAKQFAEMFKDTLAYSPSKCKWFHYEDGKWIQDSGLHQMKAFHIYSKAIKDAVESETDFWVKVDAYKRSIPYGNLYKMKAVVREAKCYMLLEGK